MANENKKEIETFYGIDVISDFDLYMALDRTIIEVTSAGLLVARYYDVHGVSSDNYTELYFDRFTDSGQNITVEDVMKKIKEVADADFISRSAIDYIRTLTEDPDIGVKSRNKTPLNFYYRFDWIYFLL